MMVSPLDCFGSISFADRSLNNIQFPWKMVPKRIPKWTVPNAWFLMDVSWLILVHLAHVSQHSTALPGSLLHPEECEYSPV